MFISSLLIILSLVSLTSQSPHILDDIEICKISVDSKRKIEYYVPSYITAEDSNIILMFSLCGNIPDVFPNDGSCSRTCIYNKKLRSLVSGNQHIKTLFDVDEYRPNEVILILRDELSCKNNNNYTITVRMMESFQLFRKPRLTVEDCDIVVDIIKPDYEPPCTHLVESKDFINLMPLKGKNIPITWGEKVFNIALCGTNKYCGTGTTGCLKVNNTMMKLGSTIFQKVKFDKEKDELKIVSSYKDQRKKVNMEIILKCNWEVETFSNAKFINQSTQGRTYKFEVDSSYGCVKMPPNCLIKDNDNGLVYDLRGLTEETGTKVKLDSKQKMLLMHICGDLKVNHLNQNNECEKQHSHICEIDGSIYTNKGSIPSFEITRQHDVKVFLRNGQKCSENSYTTEIDIKCSFYDKGPIVIKSENCYMKILWETSKGCPKFQSEEDGCAIKTHLGVINIANLYNENDRIHLFSPSDKFKFNICGKLHTTCLSDNEVSACYESNGTEYIIGWNNPKFSYTNGRLQLKYSGMKCKNANKYSSLTINFYCSYAKFPRKTTLYRRDSCTFEADIYSVSACLNTDTEDCLYKNDGVTYDLTPLIAKETNYQVQDKNDENLIFFLNICRSLINQNGLIAGNSMIYLMDKSIPHIWYKYRSLGKIAHPTVSSDGKLVINSILGHTCELGRDYSSVIHFECTETNELPQFIRKKGCMFEFLWRTKYACNKHQGSLLEGSHFLEKQSDKIRNKSKSEINENPATSTNISVIEREVDNHKSNHPKNEADIHVEGYNKPKQMIKVRYVDSEQNKEHAIVTTGSQMLKPIDNLGYQKYNTVKIGTKTFNLKNIQVFNVTGKDMYIINFNGASTNCPGRICRNLTAILSFIENSPEVFTFESHVVLNFTVEGKCLINDISTKNLRTADLKIKICLKCSESSTMTLTVETNCFIGFTYYSPQICNFIESSNGISVVTLFVGLTFLLIAFILGYLFYRKNKAKCSYNNIHNSERSILNHSKLL